MSDEIDRQREINEALREYRFHKANPAQIGCRILVSFTPSGRAAIHHQYALTPSPIRLRTPHTNEMDIAAAAAHEFCRVSSLREVSQADPMPTIFDGNRLRCTITIPKRILYDTIGRQRMIVMFVAAAARVTLTREQIESGSIT